MFGFTGGVSSAVLTQNIVHIRVNKRGRRGKGSKGRQCGRYLDLQEKSNYSPAVGRVPTSNYKAAYEKYNELCFSKGLKVSGV